MLAFSNEIRVPATAFDKAGNEGAKRTTVTGHTDKELTDSNRTAVQGPKGLPVRAERIRRGSRIRRISDAKAVWRSVMILRNNATEPAG